MDLRNVLSLLLRWLWAIVLVAVAACVTVYVVMVAAGLIPHYSATAIVSVGSDIYENTQDSSYLELADTMMANYLELVKTELITQAVVDELQLPETAETVADLLNVRVLEGTLMLEIRAQYSSPEGAAAIANSVARQIAGLAPSRLRNFVRVVEPARPPQGADATAVLPVMLAGFTAALVAGTLVLFLTYVQQPIYDERDVAELLALPTFIRLRFGALGRLRHLRGQADQMIDATLWWSLKEACARLVETKRGQERPFTILVISPLPSLSSAYVAANLARSWADEGVDTALVDIDVTDGEAGYLAGCRDVGQVTASRLHSATESDIVLSASPSPNLWVLPAGESLTRAVPRQWRLVMQQIWTAVAPYAVRVWHGPPANTAVQTLMAASQADLVLLVIDVRQVKYEAAAETVALLATNGIEVDAAVLSDLGLRSDGWRQLQRWARALRRAQWTRSQAQPAYPTSKTRPAG